MSDAYVAQLVRAVDRQLKDLGSNPSAVESVFFSTEGFSNSLNYLLYLHFSLFSYVKTVF